MWRCRPACRPPCHPLSLRDVPLEGNMPGSAAQNPGGCVAQCLRHFAHSATALMRPVRFQRRWADSAVLCWVCGMICAVFHCFCIFAGAMYQRRVRYASWLLSVILPVVFLTPFHHHSETHLSDISCDECACHQPHSGHLSDGQGTDDCLVCQLLAQQYTPSSVLAVSLPSSDSATVQCDFSDAVIACFTHHSSPRAPPVTFCF